MWNDAHWFQVAGAPGTGIKKVWKREQECQRAGCVRTRTDRVIPLTFELISRIYGGKLEVLGRVGRAELREEIIKRQVR